MHAATWTAALFASRVNLPARMWPSNQKHRAASMLFGQPPPLQLTGNQRVFGVSTHPSTAVLRQSTARETKLLYCLLKIRTKSHQKREGEADCAFLQLLVIISLLYIFFVESYSGGYFKRKKKKGRGESSTMIGLEVFFFSFFCRRKVQEGLLMSSPFSTFIPNPALSLSLSLAHFLPSQKGSFIDH